MAVGWPDSRKMRKQQHFRETSETQLNVLIHLHRSRCWCRLSQKSDLSTMPIDPSEPMASMSERFLRSGERSSAWQTVPSVLEKEPPEQKSDGIPSAGVMITVRGDDSEPFPDSSELADEVIGDRSRIELRGFRQMRLGESSDPRESIGREMVATGKRGQLAAESMEPEIPMEPPGRSICGLNSIQSGSNGGSNSGENRSLGLKRLLMRSISTQNSGPIIKSSLA